jgi:enoyl-CoA hydratase/carnithine racemase
VLDYAQQGHCVTLTINRPDMRNALGASIKTALCVALF